MSAWGARVNEVASAEGEVWCGRAGLLCRVEACVALDALLGCWVQVPKRQKRACGACGCSGGKPAELCGVPGASARCRALV